MSAGRAQRLAVYPQAPLYALDTLWLQVAGTICNLTCSHCFISCSPHNHSHPMMSAAEVHRYLEEAERLGVREYYFTGGEPFMNRELPAMLADALARGPVGVLTNGLLLKPAVAERLRALADGAEYSLDLRISIDGWSAEQNDPLRGQGSFERILEGIANLARVGLSPVITVTEACAGAGSREGRTRFLGFLRELGLHQPRLKILPLIRLGAETGRQRGYAAWETLANRTLTREELEGLQCSSSRLVSARGVYVCPILIDAPQALLGRSLEESRRPFELSSNACWTCHAEGLSCRT